MHSPDEILSFGHWPDFIWMNLRKFSWFCPVQRPKFWLFHIRSPHLLLRVLVRRWSWNQLLTPQTRRPYVFLGITVLKTIIYKWFSKGGTVSKGHHMIVSGGRHWNSPWNQASWVVVRTWLCRRVKFLTQELFTLFILFICWYLPLPQGLRTNANDMPQQTRK